MKTEMRRKLAQLPFEEKIRKVGGLIQLSRKFEAQRVRETAKHYPDSDRSLPAVAGDLPPKNPQKWRSESDLTESSGSG